MKRFPLLPALFLTLVLGACAYPPQESPTPVDSTTSSSAVSSTPLEAGDVTQSESASEAGSASGALAVAERLTSEGMLEIGSATARHTLTVYTNHACEYCREFADNHLPRLQTEYLSRGTLKLQISILPLQKYANSTAEAAALICAARQGQGLNMHHALFALQTRTAGGIATVAKNLKLDAKVFDACIQDPATEQLLSLQVTAAAANDVTLVPTFFLDGKKSVGLPYYPDLRGMLDVALQKQM